MYRRTPSGFVNSGFRGESMANEQLETSNQNVRVLFGLSFVLRRNLLHCQYSNRI